MGTIPTQAADETVDLGGTKVLVAFDPYDVKEGARKEFQEALRDP